MRSPNIDQCLEHYRSGTKPERDLERAAVKEVLAEITRRVPGKSVELRIPPFAATQIVEGPIHRRGTPSAVVEMSSQTLVTLAAGEGSWPELMAAGKILASGERSDLSALFPL